MRKLLLAAVLVATALGVVPARAATTYERVFVPMRDGVQLAVDIWRPDAGGPFPVILTLTPYHVLEKALSPRDENVPSDYAHFVQQRGYAYARADVRGTYNSGGCWDYGGLKEREDGYDLVEWLGTRAWSNGKVGMIGASYDGTTANAAAVGDDERGPPPHLATIVPISSISRWWGYAYQQGARATYSGESVDIDPPSDTPTDFMFAYGFLPPPTPNADAPDGTVGQAMRWTPCARAEQTLHGYDTQPDYDDFWKERDYLRLAHKVQVPVLVAHGFLDWNVKTWQGTEWFDALPGEKVLVAGQWPHALPASAGTTGWDSFLRKWFDRWLKGIPNGVENEPAVRVQGSNGSWTIKETWGAPQRAVSLGPQIDHTIFDDGLLTESEMVRTLNARGVIGTRYTSANVPDLEGPFRIEGRPKLHLRATSDSPSTHLVAILCDSTYETGGCTVVSRAFANARYRNGLEQGEDLVPGQPFDITLEFVDKDYTVLPGHRLHLILASSSNTWVAPDERRATNTLHLNESWLELPIA